MKIFSKLKNDLLLVFGLLIIALAALLIITITSKNGSEVVVTVNGVETARYDISKDFSTVILSGENDEFENHLVIENKTAYISFANCRDKICEHHKAISKSNENIICLPHRVVVSIENK